MISTTGLKRFVNPAVVLSVVAHGGLLVGALVLGARGAGTVAPQVVTVELVPASEVPQIDTPHVEGTPLESGSEVSSDSAKGSAATGAPRPKPALPSLERAQSLPSPQRSVSPAVAAPLTAPPGGPELAQQAEEAATEPSTNEAFLMPLAVLGLSGTGLDAPAIHPAMLPHDDTAAFRARLSSCSHFVGEHGIDDNLKIVVRVSFKRDGTLASTPATLDSTFSPHAATLMDAAVDALRRCQPFTELPADKYKEWKTLDLVVTPFAFSGG